MKFTAAALITALSLGTGLASVISVPLYARELPSSTSLLQRRSPLEDMDPLDALRLVLLRRAAAGTPPPKAGGGDKAQKPAGGAEKGKGAAGAKPEGGKDKGAAGAKAEGGKDKGASTKKKEDPWVPPSVKGDVDKNTLKCNDKTHSCTGEIIVG